MDHERESPGSPSLAEEVAMLRVQKAAGVPHDMIEKRVRELRGQIYSVKDPVERARWFGECAELLKPF